MKSRANTLAVFLCVFVILIRNAIASAPASQEASPVVQQKPLPVDVQNDYSDLVNITDGESYTVESIKYPFKNKSLFQGDLTILNGDKFLNTKGFGLSYSYFVTESWSFSLGFQKFSSEPTADSKFVGSVKSHNPEYLAAASGTYFPVYGKFIIGQWIQRMKLGVLAGLQYAEESYVQNGIKTNDRITSYGPHMGLIVLMPVSQELSVSIMSKALYQTASKI